MTSIVIEGNTTSDATLREFANKTTGAMVPISNVTVAVNDRRYDPTSEQWTDTGRAFYEVTVTGEQAIHFAATALKGTRLVIAGTLWVEDYRDTDGTTRSRRRIAAEHHGLSTRYISAHIRADVSA